MHFLKKARCRPPVGRCQLLIGNRDSIVRDLHRKRFLLPRPLSEQVNLTY
jgi:hypothetical protein